MKLSEEYQRQFALRHWSQIFDQLPPVSGHEVLDLGCSIGAQAAELAARGARVIGVDTNDELLATARARGIPRAAFRHADLREALPVDGPVSGIWSSFAAAYFPDLSPRLAAWCSNLEPGGWVALTEIDDLFGHEPVQPATKAAFDGYAHESLAANRYDFFMGHKLAGHLERAGLSVLKAFTVADRELAFEGAAPAEVLQSWAARLDRMKALQAFCGASFVAMRDDFLAALSRSDHRCRAAVHCCIAIK